MPLIQVHDLSGQIIATFTSKWCLEMEIPENFSEMERLVKYVKFGQIYNELPSQKDFYPELPWIGRASKTSE